jgi:hypothetical protein
VELSNTLKYINLDGRVIVHLMEAVEIQKRETCVILMMRDTVLGAESIIRPYMILYLRQHTSLLTVVLREKFGVDVTEEHKRGR